MNDDLKRLERRTFLCVLGAAGVAVGCGGDPVVAEPFSGGAVTDHAVGVWKLFLAQKVILGRDARGYFAYSTVCTHQGTEIEFRESTACATPTGCTAISTTGNTRCPNHLTPFDGNGVPTTQGYTSVTLPHYRVSITGGQITVHPDTTVAESVRVTA